MVVFSTFFKQIVRKNGDNAAIAIARETERERGGGSTVVKHTTRISKIKSSNPATDTGIDRKLRKSKKEMNSSKYYCIFKFYAVVILLVCKNTLAYLISDFD